tara:strand:- start:59 stop:175 length:117 start_codon:yes stop_codon:yes gene_type:complete
MEIPECATSLEEGPWEDPAALFHAPAFAKIAQQPVRPG